VLAAACIRGPKAFGLLTENTAGYYSFFFLSVFLFRGGLFSLSPAPALDGTKYHAAVYSVSRLTMHKNLTSYPGTQIWTCFS
jgi:hypothetical protein